MRVQPNPHGNPHGYKNIIKESSMADSITELDPVIDLIVGETESPSTDI